MTIGMVPMALERGSEMQAPPGLMVVGGLVVSTFATPLVLPSVLAGVIGRPAYGSASIYPDDRESKYDGPMVFAHEGHQAEVARGASEAASHHADDEIVGFLRSMLHEIRLRRHDMVTHRRPDDLLDTFGFSNTDPSDVRCKPPVGA